MILPVRREALHKREALDEADERMAYERESPSDRLAPSTKGWRRWRAGASTRCAAAVL
jgi:hypothetical protein